MSVLVGERSGSVATTGGAEGVRVSSAPGSTRRRPRPVESRRPQIRARVVAGRRSLPVRSCVVRPVQVRRWPLLAAVAVAAFLVVAGLGVLANGVSGGAGVPGQTMLVSVAPGETLWDVATRFAPDSDPGEVVRRIEQLNGLADASVTPGLPLAVPYQAGVALAGR